MLPIFLRVRTVLSVFAGIQSSYALAISNNTELNSNTTVVNSNNTEQLATSQSYVGSCRRTKVAILLVPHIGVFARR